MFGPLDKMFDFNHDGKLNGFERAAEYEFMSKQGFCGDTKSDDSEAVSYTHLTLPTTSRV